MLLSPPPTFSRFVRHILLVLASLAACLATAQTNASISTSDARVQGLHYVAGTNPGQKATWTFHSGPVPGWDPRYLRQVTWSVDGTQAKFTHAMAGGPEGDMPEMPPGAYDFTYTATGVGKHTVTVQVDYNYSPGPGTTTVAAIGGPLSYSVFNAQDGTSVPTHDKNDSTKPFHLQYFDYTFGVSSTPTGAQQPQCGSAAPALTQISPGTTYTWTINGPGQAFATGLNGPSVFVAASGQSGSGAIKARLAYHYDDGAGLVGDAQDDSEATPPPGQTTPNATYYSFTAHRPTRVEKVGNPVTLTHHAGGVYPSTNPWTYQDAFIHQLLDNNSDGQPGVWVTERFPNAATALAQWNSATGQSLSLDSAGNTSLNFDSNADGTLGNADQIGLQDIVANQSHPNPSTYPALILNQQYFAATHTTTLGAWGILVQNWTNTCGTTSVSHEKS